MEQETSKSSFLGVGLTMTVAVIVLGLAVFAVSRGIMNNAQTSFVRTMDGASTAGLGDFDGQTLSGVKVRSALEDYEGQPYFILVNTAALQKKYNPDGKAEKVNGEGKAAAAVKKSLATRESYAGGTDGLTSTEIAAGKTDNSSLQVVAFGGREYIIYNAQLDMSVKDQNKFEDSNAGFINWEGILATEDGIIQFNTKKINWKTSGCTEYISPSSNFVSKLIKDPSGTTVGMLFTEVY